MAGVTVAPWSIPYPTGSDRVADGDNAMQAIAERVAALMGATLTVGTYAPNVVDLPLSSSTAVYTRAGAQVTVWAYAGIAGASFGPWTTPPPITPHSGFLRGIQPVGLCRLLRQGVGMYTGFIMAPSATGFAFTDSAGTQWGAGHPVQVAAGDAISWQYTYPISAPA